MGLVPAIPTEQIPRIQEASPESKPYQPFGSAKEVFYAQDPEVLIAGAAGTGKSRAVIEKLYACAAIKNPGMRGLMIRKTR
jgi:phage terminase large subunit